MRKSKKKSQLVASMNGMVLFQNKKYSIELARTCNGNELVVVTDEVFTNWIISYSDSKVAYDNHVPNYIHEKVLIFNKKYYDRIGRINKWQKFA